MLWGFFLKIVIADRAAIFVDAVYGNYLEYSNWHLLIATVLFSVQIYCDFYGYSTIAMGSAKILGIDLMENFDAPYLSSSVTEFWRRWHISLTSWFKDYLYIPLGGGRNGSLRKYINKMIVFVSSGLWHGADLSFVVWGGLNGLYQIFEDLIKPIQKKVNTLFNLNRQAIGYQLICIIMTNVLVGFSWIFFRADSLKSAFGIIRKFLQEYDFSILVNYSLFRCGLDSNNFKLLIVSVGILLFSDVCKKSNIKIREIVIAQACWIRCLFIAVSVCAILLFGIWGTAYDATSFIYFQF